MLLLTFCILSLWPGNLAHTKGKGTGSGRLSSRQRSPQRSVNIVKVYTELEKIMYAFCFPPSVHLFRFLSDLYFLPLCTRLFFSKDGSADVVQTPVSRRGNNTDFSIRPQEMDVACAAYIVFPTVCVSCTYMYLYVPGLCRNIEWYHKELPSIWFKVNVQWATWQLHKPFIITEINLQYRNS